MRQRPAGGCPLRVPEPDGRIISAAGEQASIGGKGQAVDAFGMPARPEQGATLDVPQLEAAIPAPAGQCASIRAEGKGLDDVGMRLPDQVQGLACPLAHTRTSPRLLPAAQYCPLRLMATADDGIEGLGKDALMEQSPRTSVVSCISTPCRDAPRMASCDRSRPRRCPRSTRSSDSTLAGP